MYRPLYCKNDIVNRNTTPKVKFFSLICRTQMLKGDAGVNVHCRSVFAAVLNRAVHSRRLQGSLWSWRALIHSQITSNCFEQSIAFLEHFCWQALLHDRRKYQGPPNPPPPQLPKRHTHIAFATLPPWQLCGLLSCQLADTCRLAWDTKKKEKKRGCLSLSYSPS